MGGIDYLELVPRFKGAAEYVFAQLLCHNWDVTKGQFVKQSIAGLNSKFSFS